MNIKTLLLPGMLLLFQYASGQEDWRSRFAASDAVYTRVLCDVEIKRQQGQWVAVSDHYEDMHWLTENSVKLMSRGKIFHSHFNELKKWEAYTRNADNRKIAVTNISTNSSLQDYIFYDDSKATSFDFAGAGVNGSRHIYYQHFHKDIRLFPPFYFQRYFPVADGEFRITFPSAIRLKYVILGEHAGRVVFTESRKKDKTTYSFRITNLAGQQNFPSAPDDAWYATHLIYYVEQIEENREWKNFLSTPEDLYRHSYEFIRNINSELSTELRQLTDSVTANASTPMEKARRIYSWVQKNIKYVAFEDGMEGFIPRDASLVCSRRYGDCKDMSSILTAMLNYAGVPAYFTWIGTRDRPYDYTDLPLPIVDNHMICAIRDGEEWIFLDGTDAGCIFGMPPYSLQGKQAMISISEKEFSIVRVPVIPKETSIKRDTTFLELTENGLTGKIHISLSGYYSSSLYSTLAWRNEKDHPDFLKSFYSRGNNKAKYSNWNVEFSEDRSQAKVKADFELPDHARRLGDEWFINLNLFKWFENDRMDLAKRNVAVEYNHQSESGYVTSLRIPDGYRISWIPEGDEFRNDAWGFRMNYHQKDNVVYFSFEFETDKLMTGPELFPALNEVLERMSSHYKKTIALIKK